MKTESIKVPVILASIAVLVLLCLAAVSPTGGGGTGSAYTLPNYQTGTGYTNVTGDLGSVIICSNAATFTLTIPQAGSAGFPSGWWFRVLNLGSGSVVLTPAAGNINGAATRSINTRDGGIVMSDGTNYNFINGKVYQVMQHAAASTQYRSVQAADTSGTSYTDGSIVGDATRTNANVLGALTADSVKATNAVQGASFSSAGSGDLVITSTNTGNVVIQTNVTASSSLTTPTANLATANIGTLNLTNNMVAPATTPALGASGTNIVVDYNYRAMYLATTTNMNLSSFNTAPSAGNTVGTLLVILANGGNVIVNSGLTSMKVANASVIFPVTITNGDWGAFSFRSFGANNTNNGVAYSFIH